MDISLTKRALAPIITAIILIVIGTIVVIGMLSWGKNFTNDALSKTTSFGNLTASDAENFIYLKDLKDGVLIFNYNPPSSIKDEITITHYKLANISGMTPIELETPITLTPNSQNIIYLDCLYAYSVTGEVKLKLITSDNKYIDLTTRDPDLICTSNGNGSPEDPIVLCSAEDLDNIRNNLSVNYILGKDIDLKCLSRESENGWLPIEGEEEAFSGSLDGKGHIISNLEINMSSTYDEYLGLFSVINESATITNLKLEDVNIYGSDISYVGSIVGYNIGEISNCYSTGTIFSGNGESGDVGGLVGYNEVQGQITESNFNGSVSGSSNIGGLVGYNYGPISASYSAGSVSGSSTIGGLVGYNSGSISVSYSTSTVSGDDYVGGLVGYNTNSITENYSTGSVSGINYIGGLVGYNSDSITENYSTSSVSGTSDVGGLVGFNEGGAEISKCYSAGAVSGTSYVGGFLGLNNSGYVYDSYWDTETSGQETSASDEVGKTTTEMKQQETFEDWDFTDIWAIQEDTTYPYLRNNTSESLPSPILSVTSNYESGEYGYLSLDIILSSEAESIYYTTNETDPTCSGTGTLYSSPITITTGTTIIKAIACQAGNGTEVNTFTYELLEPNMIYTPEDLNNIRNNLSGFYVLGADIDLNVSPYNQGEGWIPIGNDSESFSGGLDGDGYTISNLYINATEINYVGLFGMSYGATISNLYLEDVNIPGSNISYVGSIVGYSDGIITNCYSSGIISGNEGIGGLVGSNNATGQIIESGFDGEVTGTSTIGGLIGNNNGIITDSYSEGEVSGTGYNTYVGGLVGNNYGSITESYSTSTVSGTNYVGGLLGLNSGEISTSYSNGSVSGTSNVGGLIGVSSDDSVSNSYSESIVSATGDAVGGLIGMLSGSIISSCYSIGDVSGSQYVGGLIGKASEGEISDSNSSGDSSGVYNVGCLIGGVNAEGEPDIVNSTGTGLYECTGEECSEGCPIGGYFYYH